MMALRSLFFVALLCVPTLATLRRKKPAQSATVSKAMDQFKDVLTHPADEMMAALSPQCQKGVKAEEERQKNPAEQNTRCEHTPCTARMHMAQKGGPEQSAEGPMCLPKECQNKADVKTITRHMNKVFKEEFADKHEEIDSMTVEIACPNGVDTGAGGDGEISVGDDYVSDAQPLPAVGHPAAPRTKHTKAGAPSALAPTVAVLVAVVANLISL